MIFQDPPPPQWTSKQCRSRWDGSYEPSHIWAISPGSIPFKPSHLDLNCLPRPDFGMWWITCTVMNDPSAVDRYEFIFHWSSELILNNIVTNLLKLKTNIGHKQFEVIIQLEAWWTAKALKGKNGYTVQLAYTKVVSRYILIFNTL